jgi:cell division protein FtsI/penicillin-binding protein 2
MKYDVSSPLQPEFCGAFFQLPGSSNKYRDDRKHGFLNLRQAIAESCDVYFYRVAQRLRSCSAASQVRGPNDGLATFGANEVWLVAARTHR